MKALEPAANVDYGNMVPVVIIAGDILKRLVGQKLVDQIFLENAEFSYGSIKAGRGRDRKAES